LGFKKKNGTDSAKPPSVQEEEKKKEKERKVKVSLRCHICIHVCGAISVQDKFWLRCHLFHCPATRGMEKKVLALLRAGMV
jgi:hypothetical protein